MGGAELIWEERWLWLAVSVTVAWLASWWIWAMDRYAAEGSWWARLLQAPWMPALWHALRWTYYLGLPAFVFFGRRALTGRGLGLQSLLFLDRTLPTATRLVNWRDWVADGGITVAVIAVVLSVRWLTLRRSGFTRSRWREGPWAAGREALLHEVHWAFYREPFVLLWGSGTGSWAGLMLVALEAAFNPLRWRDFRQSDRLLLLLWRAALAVVSVLLFQMTGNLLLMILADGCLTLCGEGGASWVRLRHLQGTEGDASRDSSSLPTQGILTLP